ncbi:MAG: hypothetical protein PHU35_01835 [Bacteroidales bacterium]|jgi:hypothetical protein|nr:hypothetical protein [Bacteroidales bacterium]
MGKNVILNFNEKVGLLDILKFKKNSLNPFSKKHKNDNEIIIGDRIGRDGKLAFIYQIIDRTNNYYKKFVKVENQVIKNIEGKLTEHHR